MKISDICFPNLGKKLKLPCLKFNQKSFFFLTIKNDDSYILKEN